MLLASCDIETTGLNPDRHQILELAVILWDTRDLDQTPVEDLPTFHTYILPDPGEGVSGDPFALAMNAAILKRIANEEPGYTYLQAKDVAPRLRMWMASGARESIDEQYRTKMCFTGKNFGSFDYQFLRRLPKWDSNIRAMHRYIDPGTLWFNAKHDEIIPTMDECCKRAGLLERRADGTFGDSITTKHDAVGDARIVIELLRRAWR